MSEVMRHPRSSDELEDFERTCMHNLLSAPEERVYFKDRMSRFLLVSAGWLAACVPGLELADIAGKTDFDVFGEEHAASAFADEQRILVTGEAVVGKLERETFAGRPDVWVSSTKLPLRDWRGAVVGTFGISRDVTAQRHAELALAYQALHDPVTGLVNRVGFMDQLDQALAALDREPGALAVLFVDLDGFKEINDSFGHDVGDLVLAEAVRRISRLARSVDTVARMGGDEFVVLCRSMGPDDDVRLIAERMARTLGARWIEGELDLSITCSIGAVMTSDPGRAPEDLLRAADSAMYQAKRVGGNGYRIFDPTQGERPVPHHLFAAELRRAVKVPELYLDYQPIFSVDGGSLRGVEALVRWRHPERGVLAPGEFIGFAEDRGLISLIDSFVLDEACRQFAEWSTWDGWPAGFMMSVNVSGRQLSDPDFVWRIAEVIDRHAVDPARVCLELTETALVGEIGEIAEALSALSSLGIRLALDDFGTGCSSLAHLQRLVVDTLKVDQTFVEQIEGSERDRTIVTALTPMAHSLGMSTIAEGVETSAQLANLGTIGCDLAQGFLLARPMTPAQVVDLAGVTPGSPVARDAREVTVLAPFALPSVARRAARLRLPHRLSGPRR